MKLEQLTFTRFIAAFPIIIFHYGINIFPFNSDSINFLFQQANIGVSYFFILSGFVMIIAYNKKDKIDFQDFIQRRIARIYPVFLLAIFILLTYFIINNKIISVKALILNITALQSWVPGYALSFNFPGWSLTVELFFYFSFPYLFNYFYKKYSYKKLIIPIFLFFIVSQIALHIFKFSSFYNGFPSRSHDLIFYFPLMHLNEFLIGNLAGLFFLKGIKVRNYDLPITLLILLLFIILKTNDSICFHNGMLAFIFVPMLILISANNGVLTKISSNKYLIFLGEISYGIYILQSPIYTWITGILVFFNINNSNVIFYTSLFVLICFSAISYIFFETPLRNIINKKNFSFNLNNSK